jgi:glycosyl hydrolase family 12/cellulose binding protein with CBM1 domain
MTANVVYDFTGSGGNSNSGILCQLTKDWNVQVWLGKLGAIAPLSSTGHPFTATTIRGVAFDVYKAELSGIKTYTFVATSPQPTFSGDLLQFVQWLVDSHGLTSSICDQSISAGTDIFAGTGTTLDTTSYRVEQYIIPVFEPIHITTTTQQPSSTPSAQCAAKWAQCGGSGYVRFTCCHPGTVCNRLNAWYSQCL